MEKRSIMMMTLTMVCCIMGAALPTAHGSIDRSPEAVKKWFKELPHAKQKFTDLHFYFHDTIVAKNPTAILVAQANTTGKHSTTFGETFVFDDPLTVGPDPNSRIIGRAQGIYSSVSQGEVVLMLSMNLVFTEGNYNGSTLSVLGSDPIFHEYREMPILGGSGAFRLASGIATAKTFSLDNTKLNAIVEYHVVITHY